MTRGGGFAAALCSWIRPFNLAAFGLSGHRIDLCETPQDRTGNENSLAQVAHPRPEIVDTPHRFNWDGGG